MEGLFRILDSKSKTFLAFCFCFIFGAGSFSFLESGDLLFYSYAAIFLVLFFIIIFWQKKLARFLLCCLLVFIFGGMRFLISIPNHDSSRIEYYNGNKVVLRGWVSAEPNIGISDGKYVISVNGIVRTPVILGAAKNSLKINRKGSFAKAQDDNEMAPVSGKIIITTRLYPQYQYGERLEISCLLQEPKNSVDGSFNYQKYLAKQGVWSICLNPKVVSLGENQGDFLLKIMFKIKYGIQNQMSRLWSEPANSLMAGVLYGSKSGMPKDLIDSFTRTGVSHIIAVSGYNVSIIVVMLNFVLIYIGLSRRQSFWSLIILILAFVFFSGATGSVVRAGIMAGIVLFAQHIHRLSSMGRTLVYAAVIMLLFNPYVLIWDTSFQLSFLSTIGLVYLSPILENIVLKKINTKLPWLTALVEVLITTISAIATTLPLILFQFGRLSLVAPLVNVLVLWIIPWLMLFGFIALILSWIFFPLGQVVAWVVNLGLDYVIMVVNWFGKKSWSAVDAGVPFWVMLAMYLLIIVFIIRNYYGEKSKSSFV